MWRHWNKSCGHSRRNLPASLHCLLGEAERKVSITRLLEASVSATLWTGGTAYHVTGRDSFPSDCTVTIRKPTSNTFLEIIGARLDNYGVLCDIDLYGFKSFMFGMSRTINKTFLNERTYDNRNYTLCCIHNLIVNATPSNIIVLPHDAFMDAK